MVLDGAADRPQEELDGLTPLQAARLPNLNTLAREGTTGFLRVGPPTITPDSTTAHGLIWGLLLEEIPPRSLLEARQRGINFKQYDTFSYVNFARVVKREGELWLKFRRPDSQPTEALEDFCNRRHSVKSWEFELRRLNSFRGILLGRNSSASLEKPLRVTDSDPFSNNFPVIEPQHVDPQQPSVPQQNYVMAVKQLMRRSWKCLGLHERLLVPYWHTLLRKVEVESPLSRWGLDGYTFSPKRGVRGLAECIGFDLGDPVSDFNERVELALEKLNNYDLVHLHFPEPDNFSHNNEPQGKKEILESIDGALKPLTEWRSGPIVVTPDHTTPCRDSDDHAGDPVPLLMKGSTLRTDSVDQYDEISTACGALGSLRGKDLFGSMLNYSGRTILNQVRRDPKRKGRVSASRVKKFSL